MAGKKIGLVLALDGEKEFTQAVSNANKEANLLKTELKNLTKEFEGNANSMQALQAKQQALTQMQTAYQQKLEAAKRGLQNATSAYNQQSQRLNELKEKLKAAQEAQKRMEDAGDNASDSYKEQCKQVEELAKAVDKQNVNTLRASGRVTDWNKRIADANGQLRDANKAIDQNSQYLDEARKASDHCATSIDNMGNAVEGAAGNFNESTEVVTSWSEKFKGAVAGKAVSVAANAIGEIADKAKEAAEYVVEVGSSFEAAMSEVEAISGATADELDALTEKAKKLGASTKFSATESAEAFKYMSLAGWSTSQMLASVDGVMNLAAASGMDLAAASDMVTDYLSAFNMEAEKAAYMADMMAYAQANSNTTAAQLGDAYGNCASILNTAGQDIETVTALLEAMANQGLKGSEAGTALGSIMTQITKKMKDGKIQIGDMLISVADANGNFRDLTDIIIDVNAALEGMGTEERSAALAATFNKTALSGMNLVLNEGIDKVAGYEEKLRDADGAAADMANTMQDNLKGDMVKASSALEGLGVAAYEYVEGPVRGVVQGVTKVISGITEAITPQKDLFNDFIDEVEESNDRVNDLLSSSKETMENAAGDVAKLEVYKQKLIELNEAESLNEYQKYEMNAIVSDLNESIPQLAEAYDAETGKINLTSEAIAGLINVRQENLLAMASMKAKEQAMEALYEAEMNAAKADAAATEAETKLKEAMEKRQKAAEDMAGDYGDYNSEISEWEGKVKDAKKALEEATDAQVEAEDQFRLTSEAVTEAEKNAKQALEEMGMTAEETTGAVEGLKDGVTDAKEGVTDASDEMSDAFNDLKDNISDSIENSISMLDEFSGGTEVTAEEIKKNLDSQIEGISGWSENMQKLAGAAGHGMSQELYDQLAAMGPQSANLVNTLVETLASDMENGTDEFSTICEKWTEAMKLQDDSEVVASYTSLGEGISEAVQSDMDAVKESAQQGADSVIEATKGATTEIAKGVKDGAEEVTKATEEVVEESTDAVENQYTEYRKSSQEASKGIPAGIRANKSDAMKASEEIAKAAAQVINNQVPEFKRVGDNLMEGVAAGIRNGTYKVVQASVNAIDESVKEVNKRNKVNSPSKRWRDEVGKPIAEGLTAGIVSGKKDAIAASVELARSVIDGSKDELEIHSPSGIFKKLGEYISEGLGIGIKNKSGYAIKVSKDLAAKVYKESVKWMKQYESEHSVSLEEEKKFWKQLAKAVKNDSVSYKAAMSEATKNDKFVSNVRKNVKDAFGVSWYTTTAKKTVKKDADDYYGDLTKAAKKYIDNKKAIDGIGLQEEKYFWKQVQKSVGKGTQAYADAAKKIREINSSIKKGLNAEAKAEKRDYGVSGAGLDLYKSLYKVSAKAEIEYWEQIGKSKGLTAAQRIEVNKNILEAKEKYYEQLKDLEDDYYDKCKDVNDKLQSDIDDLEENYNNTLSERKSAIKDAFGLFDEFTSESEGPEKLLANMQSQAAGYALWMEQLEELEKKSTLGDAFLEELRNLGPQATATIVSLNMMTEEQLKLANDAYNQKNDLAQKQAEKETEALRASTEKQIQALQDAADKTLAEYYAEYQSAAAEIEAGMTEPLKQLAEQATTLGENATQNLVWGFRNEAESKETKKELNTVNRIFVDRMSKLPKKGEAIGKDTLAGILDGLSDKLTIQKGADSFVKQLEAAIKKSAGIASPSKRFRDIVGKQIPAGVAVGIEENTQTATDAGTGMIQQMLDQAAEQAKQQQAALADYAAGLNGGAGIIALNALVETPVAPTTNVTVNNNGVADMIAGMTAQMQVMCEEIRRMKVVLDTGTVVGEISAGVGEQLAMETRRW